MLWVVGVSANGCCSLLIVGGADGELGGNGGWTRSVGGGESIPGAIGLCILFGTGRTSLKESFPFR